MNKPFVSIIIAIFNAEHWLVRCMESVLAQTLDNVEIILINDGSSDSSSIICDKYAAQDSRIRVFHKENEGISKTRQFGVDHARGNYLVFLDSDDYVDPSIYEKMYNTAIQDNADLVVCDWFSREGDMLYPESLKVKKWDNYYLLHALLRDQPTYQTIFLFRTLLFQQYGIKFPKGHISYGEDTEIVIRLLLAGFQDQRRLLISHVDEPLYYYDRTINPGSLMKKSKAEMNYTRISLWARIGKEIKQDSLNNALYDRIVYYLFSSLWRGYDTDESFVTQYGYLKENIRQFATPGLKKWIVVRSINNKHNYLSSMSYLTIPTIIQEKLRQIKRDKSGIHVQ